MNYINIKNCRIEENNKTVLENISWSMGEHDAWLVTGPNGGGKAPFIKALSNRCKFVKNDESGEYENLFDSVAIVSLEEAAALIEEERNRDESEYMNKEDPGRSGRQYICEVLGGSSKKNAPLPAIAERLETMPQIKLCGVEKILDRGLRYMSTGEIRRTLLCRALLSGAKLIVLSDPFAGLDKESRAILLEFFNTMVTKNVADKNPDLEYPHIILSMERFIEIPESINKVLEFSGKTISFCGDRKEYEQILNEKKAEADKKREEEKNVFIAELERIKKESNVITDKINADPTGDSLIRFEDVNVGWDDHQVLRNMNWEVKKGEHFLIRGPNGSGKTTLLELITGDNMQVFREKVYLFGKRRGSGETIWDIKRQLGIVSYRLHVEYRMVGGTSLQNVIISGFKDSIGLYEVPTDFEKNTAKAWLKLAGFEGRENENFSSLSYGEQRAILIIRAAVKSPKVLILDEPCHGLDDNYRQKVLDLIEKIASTGTTTLLHVTHEESEYLDCEKNILELYPDQDPMYKVAAK